MLHTNLPKGLLYSLILYENSVEICREFFQIYYSNRYSGKKRRNPHVFVAKREADFYLLQGGVNKINIPQQSRGFCIDG